MLHAFAEDPDPGLWPHVPKERLIDDLDAALCGEAAPHAPGDGHEAVLEALARRAPRRYLRLVRELFESGAFRGRETTVTAPAVLRATTPPEDVALPTWMLAATMRAHDGALSGVGAGDGRLLGGLAGSATPWAIDGWTSELLMEGPAAVTRTFVWGEGAAMAAARDALDAGGVAFVMLDDLLPALAGAARPPAASWVAFRGALRIDGRAGTIAFDVAADGTRRRLATTLERFSSCMLAVVTGS